MSGDLGWRLTCLWLTHQVLSADGDIFDSRRDEVLVHVSKFCPVLETLVCCYPGHGNYYPPRSRITSQGLETLAKSCPMLRYLALGHCTNVNDEGLQHLSKLQDLQVVMLRGTITSGPGIIKMLENCKSLRSLLLPYTKMSKFQDNQTIPLTDATTTLLHPMQYLHTDGKTGDVEIRTAAMTPALASRDFQQLSPDVIKRLQGLWFACQENIDRRDILQSCSLPRGLSDGHFIPFILLDKQIEHGNIQEVGQVIKMYKHASFVEPTDDASMLVLGRFLNELLHPEMTNFIKCVKIGQIY